MVLGSWRWQPAQTAMDMAVVQHYIPTKTGACLFYLLRVLSPWQMPGVDMMLKLRRRSIAVAIAAGAALLLLWAAPSGAATPLSGSGDGYVTGNTVTSSRQAGPNHVVNRDITGTLSGALEGTFTEHIAGVVHPDGTVTFHGTLTLTGTVERCGSGTLVGRLQGRGQASPPVTDARATIIDQSANTISVTGHGTVRQVGVALSYTLRYSCR